MTTVLELKDKVQRYLTEVFRVEIDRDGDFVICGESAAVWVRCAVLESAKNQPTIVRIFARVLSGVAPTPELFEYIATTTDDFIFGHLSLVKEDEGTYGIWMTHRLLGDYLDAEEIRWAVGGILGSTDVLDDELKARFGGQRLVED